MSASHGTSTESSIQTAVYSTLCYRSSIQATASERTVPLAREASSHLPQALLLHSIHMSYVGGAQHWTHLPTNVIHSAPILHLSKARSATSFDIPLLVQSTCRITTGYHENHPSGTSSTVFYHPPRGCHRERDGWSRQTYFR